MDDTASISYDQSTPIPQQTDPAYIALQRLQGQTAVKTDPATVALQRLQSAPATKPTAIETSPTHPTSIEEGEASAPYTGAEPTPSLASSIIKYSPIGVVAHGVGMASDILGAGTEALGKGYDALVGQPTAATQAIANAPKTALKAATQLEQVPETAAKKALLGFESLNPNAKSEIAKIKASGQTPTWQEVFNNIPGMGSLPSDARQELTKDLGMIGEPALDPMWYLKPLGMTATGEKALKEGVLNPNLGRASEAGERALLTAGNTPLIQGKPIMQALGKGQTLLRKGAKGYTTLTEDPIFNQIAEKNKISPMSMANVSAQGMGDAMHEMINRNAQQMSISPEELSQVMMDWREPPGSQIQGANPDIIAQQRAQIEEGLPDEIKQELHYQQKMNEQYGQQEDQAMRENYLYHRQSPEFQKFLQDNFNELPKSGTGGKPGSTFNPADFERGLSNYTANEINNIASQGKLGEIFPAFAKQFGNFKGPVFDTDIARIEAARYLHNRNVVTSNDLMKTAGNAYGKTTEALSDVVGNKSGAMKDWVAVNHPAFSGTGGHLWFPKEIGDYLNGIDSPAMQKTVSPMIKSILNGSNQSVKFFNFGAWPKSALRNYGSNLMLGYLGGHFSPTNIVKAAKVILGPETSGEEKILHSPIYGDITTNQLLDQAYANRGIGMGPARAAMVQGERPEGILNNPYTRTMYSIHNKAEDASRLPVFMDALEKGSTWEGAGKSSRDTVYDYGNMGPSDVRNSKYIPFYRFMRMNIPNIIGKMITEPARTFAPEKAREAWNNARRGPEQSQEDEASMNQWQRGAGPWYEYTDKSGQPHYVNDVTVNPIEDVNRFFGEKKPGENPVASTAKSIGQYAGSSLNPIIKAPAEAAFNYNWDYRTPIDRNLAANPANPPELKEVLPGVNLPAKEAFLLSQARAMSELNQPVNPNPNLTAVERALRLLTGINSQPINVQRGQVNNALGLKNDIHAQRALMRLYGRHAGIAESQGDTYAAQLARENMNRVGGALQQQFVPDPADIALKRLQMQGK